VRPIDLGDLVLIASRVLGVDTATVLDLLDLDAADAALAEAAEAAPDAAEQAAALLHELLERRPFARGNQRVAVVATLQLLATAGFELDAEPAYALPALVGRISGGSGSREETASWLADRLRPKGSKETGMLGRFGGRGERRGGLFQRFSDRARQAVTLAQEEARELDHNYIGTEHILLGLLRVPEGVAAKVLATFGVSPEAVRAQVEEIIGRGSETPRGHIPFTPRSKKVLELALREALQLGHNYIGTEHILLGLVREGEGVAAQIMVKLGADLPRVRQRVTEMLEEQPRRTGEHKALILEELAAVFDENERLHAEVQRLRDLLRRHGIDPDNGASRTA
jgi:prophage maintenance system killer protein